MKKYEDFEIVVEKVGGADIYAVNVRQACGGKKRRRKRQLHP